MNTQSEARWAQALAAAMEQLEQGAEIESALSGCDDAEMRAALQPLLSLGAALGELPSAPDAEPAFKASLAAALAVAPAPSSLASPMAEEQAAALDARLAAASDPESKSRSKARAEQARDARAQVEPADAALSPLVDLARRLEGLPKAEAPRADFRAALARALDAAAPPSSLAGQAAADARARKHSTGELVQGLEQGLSGLRAGRERDQIRSEAPELEAELAPLFDLALALGALPPADGPGTDFKQNLAARLSFAPEPRAIRDARERARTGIARRLWRSTAFMAAAAATVIMFVAAGVTYASADALPGELLYPVKRAAEGARVWLSPEDALAGVHLGLADERLREAVLVPETAGMRLADFSSELTKALVRTDLALALGAPPELLTPPVLDWLLGARDRLIDRRKQLPPTAWRASLAMVDEAILALRSGRPLSMTPIPRLLGHDLSMASAAPLTGARPIALAGEESLESPDPDLAVASASAGGAGLALAPSRGAVAPPAQPEPAPPRGAAAAPDEDEDRNRNRNQDRDRARKPEPAEPEPDPDAPPKPLDPVVVPVTPVPEPTLAPTLPPTAVPTAEPTATTVPTEPTITEIVCWPKVVVDSGEATCEARVENPDGMEVTYEWSVVEQLLGHVEQRDYARPHIAVFISTPAPGGLMPGSPEVHVRLRLLDAQGQLVDDLAGVIEVYYGDEELG